MRNLTDKEIINREYNFYNQLMLITENCNAILQNRVGTSNDYQNYIALLNDRKNHLSDYCKCLKELTNRELQMSTKKRYDFISLKEYKLSVSAK